MRRFLIPLLATVLAAAAYGQRLDPADYVYPVLDVSRLYAANFGELRPAHFHAGIDIKTDGVEGKPLVAVADGYVSRVSLAAGGYGRALKYGSSYKDIRFFGILQPADRNFTLFYHTSCRVRHAHFTSAKSMRCGRCGLLG